MKRTRLKKFSQKDVPRLKRKAQKNFNKKIAKGKCVRCGASPEFKRITCSHYFNEGIYGSVRYDEENCDPLCWMPCHTGNVNISWEYRKQAEYKDFKIKQLGEERFKELEKRARSYKQWTVPELLEIIEKYSDEN